MLSSLAFLYIPLLFPCLIRRQPFFSEFLTQILYLSSLSLFPIYFTNPCCQPLFPNLSSQLLSPTSLPYPCSQSILPTPVAMFLFLDPFSQPQFPALVPKLCSIPPFPTPVSNYFFNPCSQPLFLILVPCSLPFFPYVWCQPLLPTSVPNSCSQLLFPTFFHFPCSQPLFIIPVPNPVFKSFFLNFCSLSLFPICFNLFATPVPNLQFQPLPPNGKFECSVSVYCRLVLHSTKRNSKKQKHFFCALRDQNFLRVITRYRSFT